MKTPLSKKTLVQFLSNKSKNESLVQRLKIAYRPLICPFVELLEEAKKAKSIFDIGCGAGQFCLLAAEFTEVKKLGGIEIKETLIKEANTLLNPYTKEKEINFYQYDGNTIPDEIINYDLLFMIDVFHHIPVSVQEIFIKKIYEKMTSGSTFIMKDIDASSPFVVMNKLHDFLLAGEIGKEYSFKKMGALLTSAGFTIVSSSKKRMWWYPHYTYIVKK